MPAMQSDVDWVGQDLQRLAAEKKLLRTPTEEEWKAIWRAATEWADAYGVVTTGVPIDEFVRKHAPGVLVEAVPSSSTNPQVNTTSGQTGAAAVSAPAAGGKVSIAPHSMPDPRERGKRYPRIKARGKRADKPAAG